MADAMQIKRRIISLINSNGPTLPVQVAKETGLSILFASAFLSELYNEKEINMTFLRVGSSPLYYLTGQEAQLEPFSRYLKSKEKDAYVLLKERKILKDSEQSPAIRVALREIKDFAIPFEKNGEGFWKYFLGEEPEEVIVEVVEIPKKEIEAELPVVEIKEIIEVKKEKELNIFDNEEEEEKEVKEKKETKAKKPKKETKKKTSKTEKRDENFFNKIKEFLGKKKIEILDIKDFKNDEAILKVKSKGEEELLFVFNQKKISEKELLKAYKKAADNKMKYSVLSLGETPKKLDELINAMKSLSDIGKLD
jgi:hypothetical protein